MAQNELLLGLTQAGLTVSAVALALFLLRRTLKKRYPARAVCVIWALLAVRLLFPVQLTLPDPPIQLTPPERTLYVTYRWNTDAADGTLQAGQAQAERPRGTWMTKNEFESRAVNVNGPWMNAIHVDNVLLLFWLTGVLYNVFWQTRGYRRYIRRLKETSAEVQSEALRGIFEEQKRSLGIRRAIPLRVSGAADCPMLAGFAEPVLWLPREDLPAQDAMFIFRHELTHYKRRDLWLKLLLVAARSVHWFNPLVRLLTRFAQEDIELACDDAVVRGMDGGQRRAYGETILRSAQAQVRRRALVSCFTGDKETLMRRFEGLFDKRAKKRGAALIVAAAVLVASLGCAVSVGNAGDRVTEDEIMAAANEYGQALLTNDGHRAYEVFSEKVKASSGLGDETNTENILDSDSSDPWAINTSWWPIIKYALVFEQDTQTCLMIRERDSADERGEQAYGITPGTPAREAVRLRFVRENQKVVIDNVETLLMVGDNIDSLDDFRLLYENDLGLPENTGMASADAAERCREILRLSGGSTEVVRRWDVTNDGENDLAEVRHTFDNGEQLSIIMAAGQPQDYTYGGGENARTAADLAQQYARAVAYKSVWPLYPVLSEQEQQALVRQQQHLAGSEDENAVWYTKYGGSSPSYRNYVIVPTEEANTCVAVFQMYGGGTTDYRSAIAITAGEENGRRVISKMQRCDDHLSFIQDQLAGQDAGYTMREIFGLYYDSGLPWPDLQYGNTGETVVNASFYNGGPITDLEQPLTAIENIFGYFGETYEEMEGNTTYIRMRTWLTAELVSQTDTEAVVRLHFIDGSPSVDVRMEKTEGYWLPVGLAEPLDGGFAATGGGVSLPVGETTEQAVRNAAGSIPLLRAGDTIELLFDPAPAGEVTIADAVVREDGARQYDERVTETDRFSYKGGAASMSYSYPVEHITAEALSSTQPADVYRGVTVSYTAADGTAHTAAFVFRIAGGAAEASRTIDSTAYVNDVYGYTLTLPACFVGQGYVTEKDGCAMFGLKNAWPEATSDPYGAGTVMMLAVEATDYLQSTFGEDWPVPSKTLAERDGLTYYLTFASDVQYDTQDRDIAAAYQEMDRAAWALDGGSLTIHAPDEAQRRARMETYLNGVAFLDGLARYARDYDSTVWTERDTVGIDGGSATVAYELWDRQHRPYYAVEVLEASDEGGYHLTRQEWVLDETTPTDSLERFLLRYDNSGLGLPAFSEARVRALLANASLTALRDPAQAMEWTLGLSGGTAGDRRVHPVWQGESWVYTFADGGQVRVGMKAVRLGDTAQPIYLPIWWDTDTEGGSGWEFDPYSYMMRKETNDFSGCTAEELAYYLSLSDGAYTENILHELDLQWRWSPQEVENAVAGNDIARAVWERHRGSLEARFPPDEIEAAYQAVRDYAAANGFAVENLRYDAASDRSQSEVIMEGGVLQDNVQQDGLTIDNVITVIGDARFGEGAWRDEADGYSFTLYRGADGKWILEDGAFGY